MKPFVRGVVLVGTLACAAGSMAAEGAVDETPSDGKLYRQLVLEDEPVGYWPFDGSDNERVVNRAANAGPLSELTGQLTGHVQFAQPGPRPEVYPLFQDDNVAAVFAGQKGSIRIKDPGERSVLDFDTGDAITIEAWINLQEVPNNRQVYLVGKGRTNNRGFARENQNYALRLSGKGGTARLSFLFRAAEEKGGRSAEFHRWNTDVGVVADGYWHHVAVTYQFGQSKDPRGYIDGVEVNGQWDLGAATQRAPVVDDDELWIGSSLGGNPRSTFAGSIDEVAIYRKALSAERIQGRYQVILPDAAEPALSDADLPEGAVLVEVHERIPAGESWAFRPQPPTTSYTQSAFGFVGIVKKYTPSGVIADRSNPYLLRARARRKLPVGEYQFMLRAKSAARLYIDGQLVAETDFMSRNASGHEAVPDLAEPQYVGLRPIAPGHQERIASVTLDGRLHVFRLETIVGGNGLRAEVGELCVAAAWQDEPFRLLGATDIATLPLTDDVWRVYEANLRQTLQELDAKTRFTVSAETSQYWQRRHDIARHEIGQLPPLELPDVPAGLPVNNEIDRFISARLAKERTEPAPLTDDYAFLRRVTLDAIGVVPTRQEISAFMSDRRADRRQHVVNRLLDDPRWAGNWVGYWQDVLAENPGILKPKLNNTGPFRYWIHESFLDNKPIDRFVTELIAMQGSSYGGGPAGFAMATQNDVPMAAKAHVLGKAFLGLELTCARCHDAPYHSYEQKELFHLAAMLDRKTIALPETSTVPTTPGGRKPLITISLKPGDKIEPMWPFDRLAPRQLPADVLPDHDDTRLELAAIITSPRNRRFAQVMVNRLWQRYLGVGLVEPVDDWEGVTPSHQHLLDYLARQLVLHDYDLKHVARLILNSHVYQRQIRPPLSANDSPEHRLFAAPGRRRMMAEQLVDSLFWVVEKDFRSEPLTLDPEGRRTSETFLNLGKPTRAWQFASLSNERDRPALALPMTQSIVDVLLAFGWRDSRPNPITVRDQTPTVLQPLILANGTVASRVTRLSDDSAITRLCLENRPLGDLVEQVCLQILSRPPNRQERAMFVELLADGYENRRVAESRVAAKATVRQRTAVSWSNHLSPEATNIKLDLERAVRAGDPPTGSLQADWRKRMEDVVWALINTPEFVFMP